MPHLRIKLSQPCVVTSMINTFVTSFRLRNTYKTNSIIYALKTIPLVNKLLPNTLYANPGLKAFANIISILFEIGSVFLGKILYLLLMVVGALKLMDAASPDAFVHVFFFLSLAGGLTNTHVFNPTKDKYYAMFLMRMNAWEYTLSNYLYFLLKMAVGFLPFSLLFGRAMGVETVVCLVMPFFVCGVKLIIAAITLYDCRDGEKVRNENLPSVIIWSGTALLMVAAYLPPFLGYTMNQTLFLALCGVTIAAGALCFSYVWQFKKYRTVYRTLLTSNNLVMNTVSSAQVKQKAYHKKIEADLSQTSNKSGYAYFNELFMKRHSKMLTRAAKKIALVLAGVVAAAILTCFYLPGIMPIINTLLLSYLPYSLLIMYFVNRGRAITEAMFMNCDHSMLTYRVYRQPKAILSLFTERLKYVSAINLLPASVMALGLPLLLYVSGGTANPMNYLIFVISIPVMSVFFSVHTLVLYYLLQPYNAKMETKNPVYMILDMVTYYICFFSAGKVASTLAFGVGVTIFCVLYVIIGLVLVYRLAPKTFKLRG